MALPKPAVDYRNFRLSKINQEEYRHLWLLLLWPAYLVRYIIIENLNPAAQYYPIHCALDDAIPFHEGFLIPYVIWYGFIVGMHLYTMFYDVPAFRAYTKFMAISLTMSTCVFLLFSSCQNLRPVTFERDNVLTRVVQLIYSVDTNTNVFPSEHVIGSIAVLAAAIHTESLRTPKRITVIAVTAFFTSIATVFLKQHSVLDVIAAFPICIIAYWICYEKKAGRRKERKK